MLSSRPRTAPRRGEVAVALSDDNSIGSIINSIAQMNMSNNANMIRAINGSMSTTNSKLRQALVATQQQAAALASAVNDAHSLAIGVGCTSPRKE